jgi:two-component system CheB/CheR fusion protein
MAKPKKTPSSPAGPPEKTLSPVTAPVAHLPFPIVGIGASAGGLEAFTELLAQLAPDTGMAFVLIQHLSPNHRSALSQLLARVCRVPVQEVTADIRVQPNQVYIIPPDQNLVLADETLKLVPRPDAHVSNRSIDSFFESLAAACGERAIGVVLSGTATDGTLGLEAIKAGGGFTFAQDDSAKFESMPRSAIATGCVDLVLSPAKIAEELGRIARHPFLKTEPATSLLIGSADENAGPIEKQTDDKPPLPGDNGTIADARTEDFKRILALLSNHAHVDFNAYKPTTIYRRIRRRMVLNRLTKLKDYVSFLPKNSGELDLLYADVLIHVTSFFRNSEAFDALKEQAVVSLLREPRGDKIRVWVPACSTGQEAFSVAMALTEVTDGMAKPPELQIFATDLNGALLDQGRSGLFSKAALVEVSPARIGRFFVEEQGGYRICKSLRDLVVFAQQDLLNDPPFSRLDLVCCRNFLIYLEPAFQQKVFATFHYALKPNGILFLGASESVGTSPKLFEAVARSHKIFLRKEGPSPSMRFTARDSTNRKENTASPRALASEQFYGEIDIQRESDRVTLNLYAPCSVLINSELQILQFRGDTSPWLKPPTGRAHFNLLNMAREGLAGPLREALEQSKTEGRSVRRDNLPSGPDADGRPASIEVVPLKNLKQRCTLIFFEDTGKSPVRRADDQAASVRRQGGMKTESDSLQVTQRIADLEQELHESRDYLQSFREQADATGEELQGANEEVTSANEELQSINEELETSKEEIESTNEELTTVNEELASRNDALGHLNGDLVNLQSSIDLAIVLLGRDQKIRRFSPRAAQLFNLLPADVGRPFAHIRHNLEINELDSIIAGVIGTARHFECEAQSIDNLWYSLRVRPYIALDQKIDGAVLVLMEIDALKRSQLQIADARDYAEAITRSAPDPIVVLTADLRIEKANPAFYKFFEQAPQETEGRSIYELGTGQWNTPALRLPLEQIAADKRDLNDCTATLDFPRIGRRTVVLNARLLNGSGTAKILLTIRDLTQLLGFQIAIRRSELRYRRLFEAARDGVLILDPLTRKIVDANPFMTELLGYTHAELLGKEIFQIGLKENENASRAAFHELQNKGLIRFEDQPLQTKTGERREVEMVSNLYDQEGEKVIQCNVRDITVRKQAEQSLADTHAKLEERAEELTRFNRAAVDRELRMIELKKEINRFCEQVGQPLRFPLEFIQAEPASVEPVVSPLKSAPAAAPDNV